MIPSGPELRVGRRQARSRGRLGLTTAGSISAHSTRLVAGHHSPRKRNDLRIPERRKNQFHGKCCAVLDTKENKSTPRFTPEPSSADIHSNLIPQSNTWAVRAAGRRTPPVQTGTLHSQTTLKPSPSSIKLPGSDAARSRGRFPIPLAKPDARRIDAFSREELSCRDWDDIPF